MLVTCTTHCSALTHFHVFDDSDVSDVRAACILSFCNSMYLHMKFLIFSTHFLFPHRVSRTFAPPQFPYPCVSTLGGGECCGGEGYRDTRRVSRSSFRTHDSVTYRSHTKPRIHALFIAGHARVIQARRPRFLASIYKPAACTRPRSFDDSLSSSSACCSMFARVALSCPFPLVSLT